MQNEIDFMKRAIELAKKGEGFTNPNPLVGAVIVKDGKIIGEGYHQKYGDLHAEREALLDVKKNGADASGAVMFVTLEPCSHYGKQPPCTEAVLEAGISKVYVGSRDPNPLVSGRGVQFLKEHGIEVVQDFLKEECDELNAIFFYFITKNLPYVALKWAMTMDGKICTKKGESKWITNEKSRLFVHELRRRYSAILCGIGTVLKDDPMLNCRLDNPSNPIRIVCDSNLRLPLESKLVQSAGKIPVIAVCVKSDEETHLERKASLEEAGVEVLELDKNNENRPDLSQLLRILGDRKIDSLLVEGGAEINYSFLSAGLANYVYAFMGAKVFGSEGKSPVSGEGVDTVEEAFCFRLKKVRAFGDDILAEYEV